MSKRAAICIGVNRAGSMIKLQAAVKGACDFAKWARRQGCDTKLLVDEIDKVDEDCRDITLLINKNNSAVWVAHIFNIVNQFVQAGTYEQLIIYFSGHGILTAPGTEYWMLSDAPQNPNEAVNLSLSATYARNSGIPHVIFISDACRSAVQGPPLSGMIGSIIFPNNATRVWQGVIDVFYATRPGDPAWEIPESQATRDYKGLFTDCLIQAVTTPDSDLCQENPGPPPFLVVTSHQLKKYLVENVPIKAGFFDVRLRQQPEVRVESILPQYFGVALDTPADELKESAVLRFRNTEGFTSEQENSLQRQEKIAFNQEVKKILDARGRAQFETRTGFTVFGAEVRSATAQGWKVEQLLIDTHEPRARHLRLTPSTTSMNVPSSLLLELSDGSGTLLPILPKFICTVVVDGKRVVSVNYVPSQNSERYADYGQQADKLELMKAAAAVASRQGAYKVPSQLDKIIRQGKNLDTVLSVYAAYSYAQAGKYKDVFDIFRSMQDDSDLPVPFDVLMLAYSYQPVNNQNESILKSSLSYHYMNYAPFAPILAQGWSLLVPSHPLYRPIHSQLRPHLIPSLWTTYTAAGLSVLHESLLTI